MPDDTDGSESVPTAGLWRYIALAAWPSSFGLLYFGLWGWDAWYHTWRLPNPTSWLVSVYILLLIALVLAGAILWRAASATSGPFHLIWSCLLLSTAWWVPTAYLSFAGQAEPEASGVAVTGMLSFALSSSALLGLRQVVSEDQETPTSTGDQALTGWGSYGWLIAVTGGAGLIVLALAAVDYAEGMSSMRTSPATVATLMALLAMAVIWRARRPSAKLAPFVLIWIVIGVSATWLAIGFYLQFTGRADWDAALALLPPLIGSVTFELLRRLSKKDTREPVRPANPARP